MKVQIYFNLHSKLWSVRHRGKVIAHRVSVGLTNCTAKVNERARQRVIERQRREVHAVIEGELLESLPNDRDGFEAFGYNPYRAAGFYTRKDGAIWWSADAVIFEGRNSMVRGARPQTKENPKHENGNNAQATVRECESVR